MCTLTCIRQATTGRISARKQDTGGESWVFTEDANSKSERRAVQDAWYRKKIIFTGMRLSQADGTSAEGGSEMEYNPGSASMKSLGLG
jgi:hypothetical protein